MLRSIPCLHEKDFECIKCACVGRIVKTCKTALQTYPEALAVVFGESDYDLSKVLIIDTMIMQLIVSKIIGLMEFL